jgi:DNA-binding transcriptional regulator YhcF (GntR family)
MREKPLYKQLALQIEKRIAESGEIRLPSLVSLSRKYSISPKTISKALHLLRGKGLLRFSRGKPAEVAANSNDAQPQKSVAVLAADIARSISEGTYRVGQALPKLDYFALTKKLSKSTVCEAFRNLARKKIVYKRGKSWIVGRSRTRIASPAASPPVVLVLVPGYGTWHSFFGYHLAPFANSFCGELNRRDVQFELVQAEPEEGGHRKLACGKGEVLRRIQQLAARFFGTLVVHAHHKESFPGLTEWLKWLCQFRKPVIWLDFANTRPDLNRKTIGHANYYRCYADTQRMVQPVVESLYTLGHRHVAVPMCVRYKDLDWAHERLNQMKELAAKHYPGLSFDAVAQDEPHWLKDIAYHDDDDIMVRHMHTIAGKQGETPASSRAAAAFRKRLRSDFPSLARLERDAAHTAVVALNQWLAINYACWFAAMEVPVPERFSLVAFDNYAFFARHPITTIDINFDDLGYRCAHLFLGDLAVCAGRKGNIPNHPKLVDRGSLARPARLRRMR